MPDNITNIDEYTFYSCSKLEKVKLSNKLENIGNYAFVIAKV